jgi:hypothetical protein
VLSTGAVTGTMATGKLTASPLGTSCGANCFSYTWGTTVTVSAQGDPGFYLHSWGADCGSGNSLQCTVAMTANRTASATFSPPNLAFVTSTAQFPTGNPESSIDATCQAAAQTAGLPGHYVGFYGTSMLSAFEQHVGSASGWVRVDGKPFAVSLGALFPNGGWGGGHSLYPLEIDEHGNAVAPGTAVLSGWNSPGFANYDCSGFTNAMAGVFAPARAGGGWSVGGVMDQYGADPTCGTPVRYYCFGTDYAVNLSPYPRATGRLAFVAYLSTGVTQNGGVATLDAACASAASSAGLPGTYAALVATSSATAASRFSTAGSPWVRTDGVQIVASAANLFASSGPILLAPLDIDAKGSVMPTGSEAFVMTGATSFDTLATSATNCSDFTDGSSSDNHLGIADGSLSDNRFAYTEILPCNWASGVYCLQQ